MASRLSELGTFFCIINTEKAKHKLYIFPIIKKPNSDHNHAHFPFKSFKMEGEVMGGQIQKKMQDELT